MAISKRTLKDGSTVYDVRYTVGVDEFGTPVRRSITCKTKRAAQIEESKMIAERDAKRGKANMTLAQYIDYHYWGITSKRLAATSLDTYEQEIRLRIKPYLGNIDIRDIDRHAIQKMIDGIETESVAKKTIGTLKTILNEAISDGIIATNPATAKFVMPPKGSKRDNGLVLANFDQIRAYLNYVSYSGSQCVQRIAYTGLLCGLRPEERYALDWEDFDFTKRAISIHSAYVKASAKHGGNQVKAPKTPRSARTIPMHPDFFLWLMFIPQSKGAFIKGASGQRISPSTAQKRWRNYLRDNPELPPITIENMRHSFATAYLADGGRIEALSKLLGHTNITTTINRYYRPDLESLKSQAYESQY